MKKGMFKGRYGNIYYELSRVGQKPMVVFTHGVGMDNKTFDAQVTALKSAYNVLVWDLPGHGHSTLKNYHKRFTVLSAECLNELMNGLHIQEAFLVGQSLGSMIVQHFQIKFPEKVRATIHVPGIELTSHVGPWVKKLVPVMMYMLKLIPSKLFYSSFGKHRAGKKEVQEYLSTTMSTTGKKLALDITEDMVYDLIDESSLLNEKPLLIVYGQKDLFFIRNSAKKWHKKEPASQCIEISNANHIANQDNPVEFNAALMEFLETVQNYRK